VWEGRGKERTPAVISEATRIGQGLFHVDRIPSVIKGSFLGVLFRNPYVHCFSRSLAEAKATKPSFP
jgi:hypothetical protein